LKLPATGIKRSADFIRCETLVISKREKFTEKLNFRDLDNLAKNVVSENILRVLLDTRVMKSARNCASFDSLCRQFQRIFFISYKGQCYFFGG
jgi:hypothetical protein